MMLIKALFHSSQMQVKVLLLCILARCTNSTTLNGTLIRRINHTFVCLRIHVNMGGEASGATAFLYCFHSNDLVCCLISL